MKNIINELQNKKQEIERNKSERDKLQGRLDQALSTLKEKFSCKTLDEADEKYEKAVNKLKKQSLDIINEFLNITEKYEWELSENPVLEIEKMIKELPEGKQKADIENRFKKLKEKYAW